MNKLLKDVRTTKEMLSVDQYFEKFCNIYSACDGHSTFSFPEIVA